MKNQFFWCIPSAMIFAGTAQPQQFSFVPAPNSPIAIAGGPGNVAIGDVNQDGKPDLVAACGKSRRLTVLLGMGNGQFRATSCSPFSVPDHPHEIGLSDFNSDNTLDLAFASHDSYGITLMLGDGKGSFTVASTSPIKMKEGRHPHTHGLAIGDLNGDGKPDLVTANNADNDVAVVLGDGRGSFTRAAGSPFAVGNAPYPLALGDLNNDGHLDIVATSTLHGHAQSRYALTLLFGDGRGDFRRSQAPVRAANPWAVTVGDVNGDHQLDIVATHWERSPLTVLLGDGRGIFIEAPDSPFNLGRAAWRATIVDANRDGKADVVAAAGDGVRVLLGDGRGGFKPAPGSPFATGKGTWRLAVGDLDGDGKLDIATSNIESDNVSVLLAR